MQSYHYQKHLIVSMEWFEPEDTRAMLQDLFAVAWGLGLTELNVSVYNADASWSLVTHFPFDTEECTTSTYRTIATFTPSNYTLFAYMPIPKFYPKKMRDLQKCPVNIAVFPCEPYVFTTIKNGQLKFDGIEIRMIKAIASKLNFTPNFILPHDISAEFNFGNTKENCYRMVGGN